MDLGWSEGERKKLIIEIDGRGREEREIVIVRVKERE